MDSKPTAEDSSLPLHVQDHIDRICTKAEDAWMAGQPPALENLLQLTDPEHRGELFRELLRLELHYRLRAGQSIRSSEYSGRFSDYSHIVRQVFEPLITSQRHVPTNHDKAPTPNSDACFAEEQTIPSGQRLGRFTVERVLGRGGFGTVYLAHDELLRRQVALKVPRPQRFSSLQELDRYLEEARTVAKLRHIGIVGVFDVERIDDKTLALVMEYVGGDSLSDRMARGTILRPEAIGLIMHVAQAVHYAHQQGFVHRDLKPSNILLDTAGKPHVTDFGLALHESSQRKRAGEFAGTLPYMAPEQIRGEAHRLDGRTDVWALGVLLYELLAGRRPFGGNTEAELRDEILHREPKPPRQIDSTISPELEEICLKCLSKRILDRFSTAEDVANRLRANVQSEIGHTAQNVLPTSGHHLLGDKKSAVKRNFLFPLLVASVAVVCVAGFIAVHEWGWIGHEPTKSAIPGTLSPSQPSLVNHASEPLDDAAKRTKSTNAPQPDAASVSESTPSNPAAPDQDKSSDAKNAGPAADPTSKPSPLLERRPDSPVAVDLVSPTPESNGPASIPPQSSKTPTKENDQQTAPPDKGVATSDVLFRGSVLDLTATRIGEMPDGWAGSQDIAVAVWQGAKVLKAIRAGKAHADLVGLQLKNDFYLQLDMLEVDFAKFEVELEANGDGDNLILRCEGRHGYPWRFTLQESERQTMEFEAPEPFLKSWRLERRGPVFTLYANARADKAAILRVDRVATFQHVILRLPETNVGLRGLRCGPLSSPVVDAKAKEARAEPTIPFEFTGSLRQFPKEWETLSQSLGVRCFRINKLHLGHSFKLQLTAAVPDGFELIGIRLLGKEDGPDFGLNLRGRLGYDVRGTWPLGDAHVMSLRNQRQLPTIEIERSDDRWSWKVGNGEPAVGQSAIFRDFDGLELELRDGASSILDISRIRIIPITPSK